MFGRFLCWLDLDEYEHEEHCMNIRVCVFQKCFDLHKLSLHVFFCLSSCTGPRSTQLALWLVTMHLRCHTSISETVRFTYEGAKFNFLLGSIPSSGISILAFWHFISLMLCMFMYACSHVFHFSFHFEKS